MADQVGTGNVTDTQLLQNAVKEEECKDEDFADDKVQISKTAIVIDSTEFQDHLICDKLKQYDISATLDGIKMELSLPEVQYDVIHNDLKIEEGTSMNIKIEFNDGILYCEDCQAHYEDYCIKCGMLVHILNGIVPSSTDNISRELPHDILEIRDYFGEYRIFASKAIPVGVKFGPFTGLSTTEHSWKIRGGKFVVNKDESNYLNWMQYINPARNVSEQNLLVFQCEHNLYYQSTCLIPKGNELLVYFGEEYKDSLRRNVEMDFVPATEHAFKDAFACTYCCLGFSSKSYLAKHKAICLVYADGEFINEELMQCPSCKIHLDRKEYIIHHMAYCSKRNDRKCILPTTGDRTVQTTGSKTGQHQMYKCQLCKYRTKYKEALKNHTNLHCEVKVYKCEDCCRRFKTNEVLRLHVKNTHACADEKGDLELSTVNYVKAHTKAKEQSCSHEMKQFKCSLCEFRTKYKTSLKRHVAVNHLKEFKYKCGTCVYKTNRKHILKRHIETRHLKVFKYNCDTCDYNTNIKSRLKTHIKTRHLKEFKHKCDTCDYKTNQKSHLKTHVETKHLKEFKYKCDQCDYKSNMKSNLKTHIETKHLKEFKYKCDTCDYKTNMQFNLKTHIETRHLQNFKYKCDTCDYKANQKTHLKTHVETKHLKEFKYKCDTCDYKTNVPFNLKIHIEAIHLKEFKYKCGTCEYKTNMQFNLKAHIETKHLKEFKYKCDTCDYKANQKYQLKRHIETRHLKEFKYNCDTCDYKSNQKANLKKHIETRHLKEFQYMCDQCDYKANWISNLKTHIETRHLREFKYKCDACGYKTVNASNLRRHMKRHDV